MKTKLYLAAAMVLVFGMLSASVVTVAEENTATYGNVIATLSGPDSVEPDTDFDVVAEGTIIEGSSFEVNAYSFWEDATYTYTPGGYVSVSSGTQLDASSFNFGSYIQKTYTLNKPAGTYKYTFVFGIRSLGHGWYDVPVDITVTVEESGSALCYKGWRPSLKDTVNSQRTVPLKFTAATCDPAGFYHDEGVVVKVTQVSTSSLVGTFSYTGSPHTGVDIGSEQYHVNWDTSGLAAGDYLIVVEFSNGDTLERTMTLR